MVMAISNPPPSKHMGIWLPLIKSFVLFCPGPAGGSGGGEFRVRLQEYVRPSLSHHKDHVDPRHQRDLPRSAGHQWRLPTNLEGRKSLLKTPLVFSFVPN